MAIVTGIARGDVGGGLAQGDAAVVAAETGSEDRGMIDTYNRAPGGGRVTGFTGAAGLDVGSGLAGGGAAVMAGHAATGDRAVIESSTEP